MRVTSDFFVSALIRRAFSTGGFAAVLRKGQPEAGAIFIRLRLRNGLEDLYAPAPQALVDSESAAARLFERRMTGADPEAVDALIAKELRFDPDLWLVELDGEDSAGLFEVAGNAAEG